MNEPVPCPSCGVLLRLPEGAVRLRCPGCQSVLELDLDDVPPPAPLAVPLPFGKPKPKPPAPSKSIEPVPGKPAAKARAINEDNDPTSPYAAPSAGQQEIDEEAREAEIRRQLKELEVKEKKAKVAFEQLAGESKTARLGLTLLSYASLSSVFTSLFAVVFIITSLTGAAILPVFMLAGGVLCLHWLLCLGGFGCCIAGPRGMRGSAIAGLVLTFLHVVFCTLALVAVVAVISMRMLEERDNTDLFLLAQLMLSNVICNLTTVADLPFYFLQESRPPTGIFLLLVVAAAVEFAKVSILGLMTNQYANAAKDADLAFAGMRFVYRIFFILLLAPIAKGCVTAFVTPSLIWIPILLGTVGYFLWWAFAWFSMFQVLKDLIEIVTAGRFTDKRRRIDTV